MLIISALKIPSNSLISSDVCLHIAHLAINRDIGVIFKEICD
jgi:hypothetical protein